MNTFKPYIKQYWKLFLLGLFFLSLEAAADLMQPMLMARVINEGVIGGDFDMIVTLGVRMLGVTLFGAVAACIRNVLASHVSQNFGAALRRDMYEKIHKLSFATIDKKERASLITRLTNDVSQVQNFLNGSMRIFVKAPLVCIGAIIMAIHLNVRLSATFLVLIPLVFLIIFIVMKQTFPLFTKMQQAIDGVNARMREYLGGVRLVKAFNRYTYENERFEETSLALADVSATAMKWSALMGPGIALLLNLGIVFILFAGGRLVQNGDAGVGEIIAFTTYTTQIAMALGMMSWVFTMYVRAKASAKRISEVIHAVEMGDVVAFDEKTIFKGGITFDAVDFSFAQEKENLTLKNISFNIPPGAKLGIIGATGAGKTTLINQLLKFYEPDKGRIYIDDHDITKIGSKILRQQIAVVPQTAVLFSGTISSNLKWGNPDASVEELIQATERACIHEFIQGLPLGYETKIEQGGKNLSGGQRQRLAIARALVKRPKVLILDDALSAVDAKTEAHIKQALNEVKETMTQIMITQKIATVASYDAIIVLDKGEIVAKGTHQQLLATSPIYQEIYASQNGKGDEFYVTT